MTLPLNIISKKDRPEKTVENTHVPFSGHQDDDDFDPDAEDNHRVIDDDEYEEEDFEADDDIPREEDEDFSESAETVNDGNGLDDEKFKEPNIKKSEKGTQTVMTLPLNMYSSLNCSSGEVWFHAWLPTSDHGTKTSPAESSNPMISLEPQCTPTGIENPVKEEIVSPLQYKRVMLIDGSSDDSITHFSELVNETPKKKKRYPLRSLNPPSL